MRLRPLVASCLLPVVLAGAAYAGPPPRDEKAADVLFRSAKAALERGDLGAACAMFAESERLDPAPGTLLNLGECEERSGKVATALGHVAEARALLAPSDYRVSFADARIAGLTRRVPHLALKVDPAPGLTVLCDDRAIDVAALGQPVPVDPGPHACVAQAPGRERGRAEATVKEGETKAMVLTLGPAAAPALPQPVTEVPPAPLAPPPVMPVREAPVARDRSGRRTIGLVIGGTGAAGIAVGVVLGLVAKGTYDDAVTSYCKAGTSSCTQPGVNGGTEAHHEATASTVAFIAGGAVLAAGGLVYFTAPSGARVGIAPTVGSRTSGFSVAGAW